MRPETGQELREAGGHIRDVAERSVGRGLGDLQPVLDFRLLHLSGVTVTVGGVILALLVVVTTWATIRLSRRALARYASRHPDVNQAALYTVSRVVTYLLILVGLLLTLDAAGIPVGKFSVFAGALGVGLGFGLQAIFNNFISGLILLFDRSLKVGDFVELEGGLRGTVQAINIRFTRITTNDNIDILVPNAEFVTKRLVNWTYGSVTRRIRVPFGVAYGTDKELVKKAALEAAARVPFTLANEGERRPQVWLIGFGDSALNYELVVWLNADAARRNTAVAAAYLWELETALAAHGIEIPFPQRDLHIRSLFGLRGSEGLAGLHGKTVAPGSGEQAEQLSAYERERLARNDASEDAEREIREDAARAATTGQAMSRSPGTGD